MKLDSIEAKAVELLFNENEMLHRVSEEQRNEIEFYEAAEMFYKDKIQSLTAIIKYKDDQIKKLEGTKTPVINNSNKDWWKFGLGGVVVGILAYIVTDRVLLK